MQIGVDGSVLTSKASRELSSKISERRLRCGSRRRVTRGHVLGRHWPPQRSNMAGRICRREATTLAAVGKGDACDTCVLPL